MVVGASVLVSVYLTTDKFHASSRAWLMTYIASMDTMTAPSILLAEVAGAIARRTGNPALGHVAVQQIERIPRLTLAPITIAAVRLAASLAADLQLKGADATYVAVAARRRADHVGRSTAETRELTRDDPSTNRSAAHTLTRTGEQDLTVKP